MAAARKASPFVSEQHAELGLTERVGVLQHGLKTGCSSPGELEMTLSTSDVAVCCSSDLESSRVRCRTSSNSRTFSIAINSLVGEGRSQLDLFICERPRRATRDHEDADRNPVTQHGHAKGRAKCTQLLCFRSAVVRVGQYIGNVNRPAFKQGASN